MRLGQSLQTVGKGLTSGIGGEWRQHPPGGDVLPLSRMISFIQAKRWCEEIQARPRGWGDVLGYPRSIEFLFRKAADEAREKDREMRKRERVGGKGDRGRSSPVEQSLGAMGTSFYLEPHR